ncbi:hypothetical protein NMK34_05850 [Micromonospora sp. BRA006-A]|uniref:hypothetical protein n=1 Tax=Micromonospora TaxID=1873 RepID=UPI00296E9524|nr:hypothetical protein [Micromonospora sp. BRA006-A]MDW3846126.1 hypothetical protein [Micromonospora sp. BRA006-A]
MGHLKVSNRKIEQVTRGAVRSPGSARPGSGSIMNLAVFGVRFVAVNFMIDGAGRVRVVRSVPVWAVVFGSGVVGGTRGVESRAGGWRCNRVNDRASAARPASGVASASPGIILAGWSLNTVPTT